MVARNFGKSKQADIIKALDSFTVRAIIVTGLNIKGAVKTIMPFQDTFAGAIKSTIAKTPPLHGAN